MSLSGFVAEVDSILCSEISENDKRDKVKAAMKSCFPIVPDVDIARIADLLVYGVASAGNALKMLISISNGLEMSAVIDTISSNLKNNLDEDYLEKLEKHLEIYLKRLTGSVSSDKKDKPDL